MQLSKALNRVQRFNKNGVSTSLSFLPVETVDEKEVAENVKEYLKMLDAIRVHKLNSDVTLKIHQFGGIRAPGLSSRSIEKIVKKASTFGIFVWVDMELPNTVDFTLELFKKFHKRYKNVGVCLQAYLKRSQSDLLDMAKLGVPIRLVKGFYKAHDFKTWKEVTRNYEKLMVLLLKKCKRPCIATHDVEMIQKAKELIRKNKIKKAEIQFFMNVRDRLAKKLAKEGFNVRVYVYYGHALLFFKGFFTFDNFRNLQRLFHIRHLF